MTNDNNDSETITLVVSRRVNINQDTVYQLKEKDLKEAVEAATGKSLDEIPDHELDNVCAEALNDHEPIIEVYALWEGQPFGDADVTRYEGSDVGLSIRRDHWKKADLIPCSSIDLHAIQDDRELAEKIDRLAQAKEVSNV